MLNVVADEFTGSMSLHAYSTQLLRCGIEFFEVIMKKAFKPCRVCGTTKYELTETNIRHYDYICLPCRSSQGKESFKKDKEKILARHKIYYLNNKDKFKKYRLKYREKYKDVLPQMRKDYYKKNKRRLNKEARVWRKNNKDLVRNRNLLFIKNNPQKKSCHVAVFLAIESGRLERKPCEVCGNLKVDAHHEDYNKPLDVVWLCRQHHADRHVEIRKNNVQRNV